MMTNLRYNFGAGPAMLPTSILQDVQAEFLDWQGHGLSIVEVGHRTEPFKAMLHQAELDLRALIDIPPHYAVLFLAGSARAQFALLPLNLLAEGQTAGYWVSGMWSKMAYDECVKIRRAYCLGSSESSHYQTVPQTMTTPWTDNTAYVYYTPNETVNGVRYASPPPSMGSPLVADMTSCFLSEPIRVEDFGVIFVGAQKNIAPAGLTIVIIREDLLSCIPEQTLPTMFDYRTHVMHHSLYATPPTFNCYVAAKVFQWVKAQGGVSVLAQANQHKASMLYHYIDTSDFYQCHIAPPARSRMNVCFSLTEPGLEAEFLREAMVHGLYGLAGHRAVGGLRASLYNAMPLSGVQALLDFMIYFSDQHHA